MATLARTRTMTRRALGLRAFLQHPVRIEQALADVRLRLENRDTLFLETVRRFVYGHPVSPYRALLLAAGCEYGDLEVEVLRNGVEAALERLRDEGVYVTADEWKGRAPIARNGVELRVSPAAFDNPSMAGAAFSGTTSGSSGSKPAPTPFGWQQLTQAANSSAVMLDAYGLTSAATAHWFPPPPGAAGLQTVLIWAKLGNPPEHWFAQTKPAGPLFDRVAMRAAFLAARTAGVRLPSPELVELSDVDVVLDWLANGPRPRVLASFASSAVRVAQEAAARGIDLTGCTAAVGGEPVTDDRRALLESVGLRVFAVYASGEAGVIGVSCPHGDAVDDYHVNLDRVAVVPAAPVTTSGAVSLLVTSLLPSAGKVLLNADVGDEAVIDRRDCGCLFDELGLDLHVSRVQSRGTQTSEGMTVSLRDLWAIAGERLALDGATHDDYQLWEGRDDAGLSRVTIAVAPHLSIDADAVVRDVLEGLGRLNPGARLAAEVWRQAGTLTVARARPRASAGGKLLPVVPEDAGHEQARLVARDVPDAATVQEPAEQVGQAD